MYPIDFTTATPREVINRSIVCHPSLLRDILKGHARREFEYASIEGGRVGEIAIMRGNTYLLGAELVEAEDVDGIMEDMGLWVQVFGAAGKLQCLTPALAKDIAGRHLEELA